MSDQFPGDTSTHAELGLMQGFPPPPEKRVTRADGIFAVPKNRWAFQNMRSLYPTMDIAPAETPVPVQRAYDTRLPDIEVAREDGTMVGFETFLQETFTDALLVVKDNAVVYETYRNGSSPRQPHIMFSCTKSFVGLLALMAIEDGAFAEGDLVSHHVPETEGSAFGDATVGEVLDMTNAVQYNEAYDEPDADIHNYLRVFEGTDPGLTSIYDYMLSLPPDPSRAHGAEHHYYTPDTDMLNWVLNRATGAGFVDLMRERIWQPVGAARGAYVQMDGQGVPFTGGGLSATPEDLARFAMMMLNKGRVGEVQIVPERVLDQIAVGGSREAFDAGGEATGVMLDGHWSYRGQWWVRRTPGKEAFTALGVFGQWIYIDPTRGVAVIKQSSQPAASDTWFADYTCNAVDAVIARLTRS